MADQRIELLSERDYDALVDLWQEAGLVYRPAGRDARAMILAQMALSQCRFFGVRDEPTPRGEGAFMARADEQGNRKGAERAVQDMGKGETRLIGAAIATHEGRKGWINRLAVRPSARRAGLARALVAACEQWLFGEEILIVAALVEGDNRASQELFSACEYERDDTLVYFRRLARPGV